MLAIAGTFPLFAASKGRGMDRTEAARLLGQTPKGRRYERVCPVCGKTFQGTARAVVCSRACGWTFQNRRRAANKPAAESDQAKAGAA